MKIYIPILLTLPLYSCSQFVKHEPTMQEKKEAFSTVAFDKNIIADFYKYDYLAQTLLLNLDTIINYKNSKNYVTVVGANGTQKRELREEDCYMFLNNNDYYDIKKIPFYLSLKVDSLWTLIGKPQIEICREKRPATLVIKKNLKERKKRILECHFLYWGLSSFNNNDSFDLIKDTALGNNCTYRIGITTDNSGW